MSSFTKSAFRSIPRSHPLRTVTLNATRPFHITSVRAAGSESDHSPSSSEHHSSEMEHHKNDQLNKQKEGKGHWKEELSSNSEAAIKADRDEIQNAGDDIANLQKQTAEQMESQHKESK